MNDADRDALDEFRSCVNMAPKQLEDWLDSDESKQVGAKESDDAESVGHASGRRIVKLLRMKQDDYTSSDFEHMRKVVGYIHRHLAQRPEGDIRETRWRYSLMNWGHDPTA
jgi:hypothetical protein